MQKQISKNFTLDELTHSDTAKKLNINNYPENEQIYNNLCNLCNYLLQPIRDKLNKPIIINSGYRCKKLNEAVNGSLTSQHCKGQAADIEIKGMSNYDLACYIKDNFNFDQLILEFANNLQNDVNSGWVHVSYISEKENRNQCLTIKSNKTGYQKGLFK